MLKIVLHSCKSITDQVHNDGDGDDDGDDDDGDDDDGIVRMSSFK